MSPDYAELANRIRILRIAEFSKASQLLQRAAFRRLLPTSDLYASNQCKERLPSVEAPPLRQECDDGILLSQTGVRLVPISHLLAHHLFRCEDCQGPLPSWSRRNGP